MICDEGLAVVPALKHPPFSAQGSSFLNGMRSPSPPSAKLGMPTRDDGPGLHARLGRGEARLRMGRGVVVVTGRNADGQ